MDLEINPLERNYSGSIVFSFVGIIIIQRNENGRELSNRIKHGINAHNENVQ